MDISRRRRPLLRAGLLAALVLAVLPALEAVATSTSTGGAPRLAAVADVPPPVLEGYELIAHRGSTTATITENTVPAFARALEVGADAIELDVRLTADRALVVMHDKRLARTTTCRGLVQNRVLAWIRQRCRGERGGEPIPTLDLALSWAAAHDVRLLLDLKMPPETWRPRDYRRLTALVRRHGVGARTRYLSFLPGHLLGVRAADPSAHIHVVVRAPAQVEDYRRWADGIHLSAESISPGLLESLRGEGIAVVGRNTDEPRSWAALRSLGVDGLLSDRLVAYGRWRDGVRT